MDARSRSKKITAAVGEKVPLRCGSCGSEAGISESMTAVTSVAKWICPKCGTQNEFEIDFTIAAG